MTLTHRYARLITALGILLAPSMVGGCQSVADQAAAVRQAQDADGRVTVGTVQREIRVGMSGDEVVQVLGSPNMVTTDEQRRETWVWDKVSTTGLSTGSSAYGTLVLLGASSGSAVTSTTQRTLTIIVKFDQAKRVRDFAYRSSSF